MSKFIPNSFQTPNICVDEIMGLLNEGEFKCYLFAIRHVYGWQDKIQRGYAHISLTMFENVFSKFEGTGLSKPTITKSLKQLVKYRLLVKVQTPDTYSKGQAYAVGQSPDIEGLKARKSKQKKVVKNVNHEGLNILTTDSKESLPKQTQDKTQVNIPSEDGAVNSLSNKKNPLFDWIVQNIFNIGDGIAINKATGARAGKCLKELKSIHSENETELTTVHLEQFVSWYRTAYDGQTIPRDSNKLAEYYTEFYSWGKNQQSTRPSATIHHISDWVNEIE